MQRRLFLGAAGASMLSACTVTGFSSSKSETPVTPATAVLPPTAQPATQPVRIGLALGGGA
ncbi:patatin-like phospholipase family protein, partial [Ralstonia sp. TCR112]